MKNSIAAAVALLLTMIGTAQAVNDITKYEVKQQIEMPVSAASNRVTTTRQTHFPASPKDERTTKILKRLNGIGALATNEVYQVSIAADVPDNKRPGKVYYKREPGHVFIILEKIDTITGTRIAQSWGFYPVRPVSCLFLRTVKCEILDNGGREYDAAITQVLTKEQFDFVKVKAIALTQKKYNLNKYNCYEYALELYNSIPGIERLEMKKVKFPFIFGRGGSPCGLYKQLLELSSKSHPASTKIFIGQARSPVSNVVPKNDTDVVKNN